MAEPIPTDWVKRASSLRLRVQNIVDGRSVAQSGDETSKKLSPRDGEPLYEFHASAKENVASAVDSARRSFEDGRWWRQSPQARHDVLLRLANLLETHAEELALFECLDVGKPISDALSIDLPFAVSVLRYNAESVDKLHAKVYAADPTCLAYQLRRPAGVVAEIVGWNFPLALAVQKVAPALATGNSAVLKPSELASLSACRLAQLALEAGVPDGVLNVVHGGAETGEFLGRHLDVDMLTFTGSSRTGKRLLVAAGESNMKRLLLECGGKAPNIVFEDCPSIDAVADAIIARAFWNQGEVCSASSRVLVQNSMREELQRQLVYRASALKPGDPLKVDTTYGALVSAGHRTKVLEYIEEGKREGAEILYASNNPPPLTSGFYVSPTIFSCVQPSHRIAREEIFGPVLSILSFEHEDEAIALANSTIYGLSAIIWTRDMGRSHRLSQGIRAGSVTVNASSAPKGGPPDCAMASGGHKQSGIGVEGGLEGLEAYTVQTAVQYFV